MIVAQPRHRQILYEPMNVSYARFNRVQAFANRITLDIRQVILSSCCNAIRLDFTFARLIRGSVIFESIYYLVVFAPITSLQLTTDMFLYVHNYCI